MSLSSVDPHAPHRMVGEGAGDGGDGGDGGCDGGGGGGDGGGINNECPP